MNDMGLADSFVPASLTPGGKETEAQVFNTIDCIGRKYNL